MHKHASPITTIFKTALSAILIAGLLVTQAVPLSDAQLIARPKSKAKAQAFVAPAEPTTAQLSVQGTTSKDPKNMAPLPCCQQSAILSIQAIVTSHSFDHEKAISHSSETAHHNSHTQIVRYLPNSRAHVHTYLALQATLVGAHPSGTS